MGKGGFPSPNFKHIIYTKYNFFKYFDYKDGTDENLKIVLRNDTKATGA